MLEQLNQQCNAAIEVADKMKGDFGLSDYEIVGGLMEVEEKLPLEEQNFLCYAIKGDIKKYMFVRGKLITELSIKELALVALSNLGMQVTSEVMT